MRVGTLHPDDVRDMQEAALSSDSTDPYYQDPHISPILKAHQQRPINAEPPGSMLTDSWITPSDLWFTRNHHPVPQVTNVEDSQLVLSVAGVANAVPISLSINDLKSKYSKHTIVSSIQVRATALIAKDFMRTRRIRAC
jgi:sulfite oxidase